MSVCKQRLEDFREGSEPGFQKKSSNVGRAGPGPQTVGLRETRHFRGRQKPLLHNYSSHRPMLSPAFPELGTGLGARDMLVRKMECAC